MKNYSFQELPPQKLTENIVSFPFSLIVEDVYSHLPQEYRIEFHCVKNQLFVPRMYPVIWHGKDFCFKKLLSAEGTYLNVRKILHTLLTIYDSKWGQLNTNYLIASGNYNFNEKNQGPSKKVLVYKRYFERSEFAKEYEFYELTDTTYIILRDPSIPRFYEGCQLFGIYDKERYFKI